MPVPATECAAPLPSCLPAARQVLAQVRSLTLDDSKVAARERARHAAAAGPPAPLPIRLTYASLCWALDALYAGRPIQRFWILETVARMPYFVYISMVGRRGSTLAGFSARPRPA